MPDQNMTAHDALMQIAAWDNHNHDGEDETGTCPTCLAQSIVVPPDLVGWAIAILSNVDAPEVGWPHQTQEWRDACRNWLDAAAASVADPEEAIPDA